jgi:adenosine kinase
MKNSLLIVGSLAYDLIFSYPASIRDHFYADPEPEPESGLALNFRAHGPEKRFGGCAGNIAYTATLMGLSASLLSWVGDDGDEYIGRLEKIGVGTSLVYRYPGVLTPTAVLLSDAEGEQVVIFGEPERQPPVGSVLPDPASVRRFYTAVIASGLTGAVPAVIDRLEQESVRYIIDPGKMIMDMDPALLRSCINGAAAVVVNKYEYGLLCSRLGLADTGLGELVGVWVITDGLLGAEVHVRGKKAVHIPAVLSDPSVGSSSPGKSNPGEDRGDTNGAGDAFLAGFVAGLASGHTSGRAAGLEFMECAVEAARLGAVAASFAADKPGCQSHTFSRDDFMARYSSSFGTPKGRQNEWIL